MKAGTRRTLAAEWPLIQLRHTLVDLLFWLDVPDAEAVARKEWIGATTDGINRRFQAVVDTIGRDAFMDHETLMDRRRDAMHFANVLHANPGITLAGWKDHFPDCLGKLREFVRQLESVELIDPSEPAEQPTPRGVAEAAAAGDPWALHCELYKSQKASHRDTAIAWKKFHPEDDRTIEQIHRASENYRAGRKRKRKPGKTPG
jgi:hypothetical protein